MSARTRQIAIAGAGIAGLAAAIAFAQRGARVRVYERAPALQEAGAGLQLSPNATRVLARLGVLDRLMPVAVRPQEVTIRRADSLFRIASVPLGAGATERWGSPYLTAHRADLQSGLAAEAKRSGDIEIVTGARVRDAAFHSGGVTLSVDRAGGIEEVRCDFAIGADGVWSALRGLGRSGRASRFTGHVAWRAMVRPHQLGGRLEEAIATDRVTAFLHRGFHLVAYPVRAGEAVNLVAITRGPEMREDWSAAGDKAVLAAAMKGTARPLLDLVRDTDWTSWPLHEADADGPWTSARGLALIGDAAHAMTPYAAQGAAMAIEDAETLATVMARRPNDLAGALALYEKIRRPRIARVARRGAFNRFTWHARGPVAMVRDAILWMRPSASNARDLDWLYGWDVEYEVAKLG